jgi:hypothetical protein
MSLCSSTGNDGEVRHAGRDGRHPDAQDASGDIRVVLDSSPPCWNDGIESRTETDPGSQPFLFSKEDTEITKKIIRQKCEK